MDIQLRKINFVQEFLRLDNEQVIAKLEKLLTAEKKKLNKRELKPFTIEEFNKRADEAEADAKAGRVTRAEDLLKEIETWR